MDGVRDVGWQEDLLVATCARATPSAEWHVGTLARPVADGRDLIVVDGEGVLSSPMPRRAADLSALMA